MAKIPSRPSSTPNAAPTKLSSVDSARTSPKRKRGFAPNARTTPNSRVRSKTLIKTVFATAIAPTTSAMALMPSRTTSVIWMPFSITLKT